MITRKLRKRKTELQRKYRSLRRSIKRAMNERWTQIEQKYLHGEAEAGRR